MGVGSPCPQHHPNGCNYRIRLVQDVIIPLPEDSKPLLSEPGISRNIPLAVQMLTAIYLNGQTQFYAYKVQDIRPVGILASELMPVDLAITEPRPQLAFCVCEIPA